MSFKYSTDGGSTWVTYSGAFPLLDRGVLPTPYMPAVLNSSELVRMYVAPTPWYELHPSGAHGDEGAYYPAGNCVGFVQPFGVVVGVSPGFVPRGSDYPYAALWAVGGDTPLTLERTSEPLLPCLSDMLPPSQPDPVLKRFVVNRVGSMATVDTYESQGIEFYISGAPEPPPPLFWTAKRGCSERL